MKLESFQHKIFQSLKKKPKRLSMRCNACNHRHFTVAKEDGIIKIRCANCDGHINNLKVEQLNIATSKLILPK